MLRGIFALTVAGLVLGSVETSMGAIQNGSQIVISRLNHNAGGVDGNYDTNATWGGGGGGGEFLVTEQIALGEIFKTFCIEVNENITLPGTYYVTLDNGAIQGGNSGGNPDPLSDATKWLYYWYVSNLLDTFDLPGGSDYFYDSQNSANELQEAIWYLEGEGSAGGLASRLVTKATSAGTFNVPNADVLVMNLWSTYPVTNEYTQRRQSQLYFRTTQGGNEVPEPASIAIWSMISLAGVIGVCRRSRQ
jgi:hypothetical protein